MPSADLRAHVTEKLKLGWTPELIAGRLRRDDATLQVSHETIYQWIYREAPELVACLPRAHPRRLRRGFRKPKRTVIPKRVSIHQRPEQVSERREAGHWEVDTVTWRRCQEALLVVAERKTMTYDNGLENVQHVTVNHRLGTKSYFCDPYQSWQKGTVENSIGLIRRLLPRSIDFSKVSEARLRKAEKLLNNRPRKCLDYQTPAEAFETECCT